MHKEWSQDLGYNTPLLEEKPKLPPYLIPYDTAFVRLCQNGLEEGFDMASIKVAYEIFPIGSMGFFFDAMYAMRAKLLTFYREEQEKSDAS